MRQSLSAHHGNYYKDAYTEEEKEEFILSYIPRIEAMAKKLQVPDELFEDFVSAGILGVIKALSKNHLIDYYLSVFIDAEIMSEMIDCFVSYTNISNASYISTFKDIKAFYAKDSLDEKPDSPIFLLPSTIALNAIFQTPDIQDQEDAIIDKVTADELKQIIVDLLNEGIIQPREAAIVIYHLGLFGKSNLSFDKVIRLLDLRITPERARQIYRKTICKIKTRANLEYLKMPHSQDLMTLKKILDFDKENQPKF